MVLLTHEGPPPPFLEVTWTDTVTGAHGHLVVDRLVRGLSSGGLRMRPGCSLAEVRDLAQLMSVKEALAYRPGQLYMPFGGAKGGIDFDPDSPHSRGVLKRYLEAMRPFIESTWAFGEDLGVRQDVLDELTAELGLRSSIQPALRFVADSAEAGLSRLRNAFAVEVDGVPLADLVGGYGVVRAAVAALAHRGEDPAGKAAAVQGFGSIGGATARYLAHAGFTVVGLVDSTGAVYHPHGLDVERLLRARSRSGVVRRGALRPGDRLLARDDWLSIEADVLVPAAISYTIDATNHDQVRAGYVIEGANAAVTAEASAALRMRGVTVVPGVIANCAANAWWWWTLFGDVGTDPAEVFHQIDSLITPLVARTFEMAPTGGDLDAAARQVAHQNLADMTRTLELIR